MKRRILALVAIIATLIVSFSACTKQAPNGTGTTGEGYNVVVKAGNIVVPESTKAISNWSGQITITGTSLTYNLVQPMNRDADGNPAWSGTLPVGTYNIIIDITISYDGGFSYVFKGTQNGFQVTSSGVSQIVIPVAQVSGTGEVLSGIKMYYNTSVTVTNTQANTVVGATVTFDAVDINNNPISVVTQGTAVTVQLPKGTWNYIISHPDYVQGAGQVTIDEGNPATWFLYHTGLVFDTEPPVISAVDNVEFIGTLSPGTGSIIAPNAAWSFDFSVTDNVGIQSVTVTSGATITSLGGGNYRFSISPVPSLATPYPAGTTVNFTITARDLKGLTTSHSVAVLRTGVN